MKMLFLNLLILSSINLNASTSLHSHEHGTVQLSVAIDGKTAQFELEGPSESFLGFEKKHSNKIENEIYQKSHDLWSNNFLKLVQFNTLLNCNVKSAKFEQILEKNTNHSEIEASSFVTCNRELKNVEVSLNFKKYFKNLKKLKVDIIGNETKNYIIETETFKLKL